MTREQLIKLARECGVIGRNDDYLHDCDREFAHAIRAATIHEVQKMMRDHPIMEWGNVIERMKG